MRVSLVFALLVVVMMTSVSDAGWRRFTRRVGRGWRRVQSYVRRHRNEIRAGVTLYRAFGKRSAGDGPLPCLPTDPKAAQELLDSLHLDCASLSVTPQTGVTSHALLSAFAAVDENGNGNLDKEELMDLESVLGAFHHCLDEKPAEEPVAQVP